MFTIKWLPTSSTMYYTRTYTNPQNVMNLNDNKVAYRVLSPP